MATLNSWTNGDEDGDWGAVGNWSLGAVPDGVHLAALNGGRITFNPSLKTTSDYNPDVVVDGLLDLSESKHTFAPASLIILGYGQVLSEAELSSDWSPVSVDIDLRKEYP